MPTLHIKITDKQHEQLKKIAFSDNDKKIRVQNEEMVQDFIARKTGKK